MKFCSVIGDDAVWHAETEDYGLDEIHSFDPLGKLVDYNEKVGAPTLGRFLQRSHDVESPRGEGPHERNRLQLRCGCVWPASELLAPDAASNDLFCVPHGHGPVESCTKSFGDQGSTAGMVPAGSPHGCRGG